MSNDERLSIEELEKKAEDGDFAEAPESAADSPGGSMSVESIRLPDDIIRAFELVGKKKRLGKTSMMRSALAEWLSENHPDILEETSQQGTVSA